MMKAHWITLHTLRARRFEARGHACLDVAFGEDKGRVRVDNAAQNFATLRRIALNLLRQDRSTKAGLKIRRLKACTSDSRRAQILGWHGP
ncbi:hypothetical protein P3T23_009707 [Paraburkholderia sp. GAS448]